MRQFILVFVMVFINQVYAQAERTREEYIAAIEKFYKSIMTDVFVSVRETEEILGNISIEVEGHHYVERCKKMKPSEKCESEAYDHLKKADLSQSVLMDLLRKDSLKFLIFDTLISRGSFKNAEIYDEGFSHSLYVILDSLNSKKVYVHLTKYPDEPIKIISIFLPDGKNFFSKYYNSNRRLKLLGIIHSNVQSVLVRTGRSIHSSVAWEMKKGDLFYFYPDSDKDWWKVSGTNSEKAGFLERKNIFPLAKLNHQQKQLLIKKNGLR